MLATEIYSPANAATAIPAESEALNPFEGLPQAMNSKQLNQFLNLAQGKEVLTAEQLASGLGLPASDIRQFALGGAENTGAVVSSNPVLSGIVKLMSLMFSLGIKVEKQSFDLIKAKLDAANLSAEEAWQGAIAQFACDMTSGVITGAVGLVGYQRSQAHKEDKTYQQPMWLGPVGAQVMTSPINSAGQFAAAEGQLDSQIAQNHSQELGEYLQQMIQLMERLRNPAF